MKVHAFRLIPGQDLKKEIDNYVIIKHIKAGSIISCVGNLSKANIRMAAYKSTDKVQPVKTFNGTFEIVSLIGTLEEGNSHLHISISDKVGKVTGGHLKVGSIVGVTAEIVIGEYNEFVFKRVLDPKTGFEELAVS